MRRQFLTVLGTEFTDHRRDRRSLFATFMYALFGPILMVGMVFMIAARVGDEKPPKLDVVGGTLAPTLVAELERREVEVRRRDGAPAGIPGLDGADAVLVVPPDYPELYAAGQPAELVLYRDERRQSSLTAARTIAQAIQAYGTEIAQSRLIARGVPAETLLPIRVRNANVSATGALTLQIATTFLYFFVFAAFIGSMSVAIDATAGERERKSLFPLLTQPVDPHVLILGKWANAGLFGTVGTVVTVLLGMNLLRIAPLEAIQVNMPLDLWTQAQMLLLLVPLTLMVAALQIMLALMAKSFKEAQTYMTLLFILPPVLGMMGSLGGREPEGLILLTPILSHMELLRGLIADGRLDWATGAGTTAICALVAIAALFQATRQLKDERILGAA